MAFSHYEEVPAHIAQKIVEENKDKMADKNHHE
jgi:translation elongation factor EF-G